MKRVSICRKQGFAAGVSIALWVFTFQVGATAAEKIDTEGLALLIGSKPLDPEGVRKAAISIQQWCGSIYLKTPVLSPSEAKWLEGEIQTGRYKNLSGSVELYKRRVKNISSNCSLYLTKMGMGPTRGLIEANYWVKLVGVLTNSSLQYDLKQLNKLDVAEFSEQEIAMAGLSDTWLAGILMNIVSPILERQLRLANKKKQ